MADGLRIVGTDIAKFYGKTQVLFDLSFEIELNQRGVVGLIGPNGAGKSTIMRLLSGITTLSAGDLTLVNSTNTVELGPWSRSNSFYAPAGERGLRNKLTLMDNLKYFSALRRDNYEQVSQNAVHYAELLNANALLAKEFGKLSTGQKKKAEIIVAVSLNTKLLILDEPSTGLDINAQEDLMDLIDTIARMHEKKIIISSHDPNFIAKSVNQYLFVSAGRIVKTVPKQLTEEMLVAQYKSLFGVVEK